MLLVLQWKIKCFLTKTFNFVFKRIQVTPNRNAGFSKFSHLGAGTNNNYCYLK